MSLELFDNTTGFRPKGSILRWWALLPQSTGTVADKSIPSLFGNLKSITIPVIMVSLTLILDGILIYQLDNEGVSILVLAALSVFDFVIAILPVAFLTKSTPSVIDTEIYIRQVKIEIPHEIPSKYEDNREKYKGDLRDEEIAFKKKRFNIKIAEMFFSLIIIVLGLSKFIFYYDVFGSDIFSLGIGRFIMAVILISIITHLFFTKTVFVYCVFIRNLNKQKKLFKKGLYKIGSDEMEKPIPLNFNVNYSPESANNQFIGQSISEVTEELVTKEDMNSGKFKKTKFMSNKNIYLICTGLLTDPEITTLYNSQGDISAQEAIIAQAKEIQLRQIKK